MLSLEKNTRALIIGLGNSGLACVRFLHGQGLRVAVSEMRTLDAVPLAHREELVRLGVALECGGHSTRFLEPECLVVPSPGVSLDQEIFRLAAREKCRIIGELGIAAGRFPVPVIAVTGTNGKTTVTGLIGHLLSTTVQATGASRQHRGAADEQEIFVGGNIGRPMLEFFEAPGKYRLAVLELSSFQLELGGDFRPDIGLLLNVTPDHLDRHGSMEHYLAAKLRVFSQQRHGDIAIIGADDPLLAAVPAGEATLLRFGIEAGCDACVTAGGILLDCVCRGQNLDEAYDLRTGRLSSRVNRLNAAAAVLAVRLAGCSRDLVRLGLATFEPEDHRMREVGRVGGVLFIDDSKATNVGAMAAAIGSCDGPVILIAGGQAKGCDFSSLASLVAERVKCMLLLGQDATLLASAFGHVVETIRVEDMETAVRTAVQRAEPGDVVLLAPGCASFDMFSGYAQRGQVFSELVASHVARSGKK